MPDMTILNKYKQTRLELTECDHRVLEILGDFVPDNVFDSHAHINPAGGLSSENESYAGYCEWMGPVLGNPSNIRLNMLAEALGDEMRTLEGRRVVNDYLSGELAKAPKCVGSPLIGPDDTPEHVLHRLAVYHEQTEPIILFYQRANLYAEVNGDQEPEKVFEELLAVVKA